MNDEITRAAWEKEFAKFLMTESYFPFEKRATNTAKENTWTKIRRWWIRITPLSLRIKAFIDPYWNNDEWEGK